MSLIHKDHFKAVEKALKKEKLKMNMRAKMILNNIKNVYPTENPTQETLCFDAVARSDSYPEDGSDENNTYAKFSPSGHLELTVANPALIGKFAVGETYYLDFTKTK